MRKQVTPYFVKTVLTHQGERLPTLVSRETGLPDFDATLWVVSSLRNKNLASETIAQALRSLLIVYLVLRSRKIDISERVRAGGFLDPVEIEAISIAARRTTASAVQDIDGVIELPVRSTSKVALLEKLRMTRATCTKGSQVDAATASIRLGYIREFLKWRINREIWQAKGEKKGDLIALRDLVDLELKNKTPSKTSRSTLGDRMGIDRQDQALLLSIVRPSDHLNPWTGEFIQVRNQFIVTAFLALGVRRGELLGMRVGDFNPQRQEVLVLRRPDDQDDPRVHEPNTKTRDRVLPFSNDLYKLLKNYIFFRNQLVRGRHAFLLVSNIGNPLSSSELNRIFNPINKCRLISMHVSPHVLRHSFCENLADDLHNSGCGDFEILGYLRRLGGWSDVSDTPYRYTKRFVQEVAAKAGLELQKGLKLSEFSIGDNNGK